MTAIYKRELRSYFNSMLGYVFAAAVTLVLGLFFTIYNLRGGHPYFAFSLSGTIMIFAFAVPLLTMKSMAEERRSRTDQMLLTYPVSVAGVILGKFFAMLTVFVIPMLISCLCPLVIAKGGGGSYLIDYSTIFLFLFLGAMFISVGMYVSSLTESQLIAAVAGMVVLLLMLLWDTLVSFIPPTVAASAVGFLILFALAALIFARSAGHPAVGIAIFGAGAIFTILCGAMASRWFATALTSFLGMFSVYGPVSNFVSNYVFDVKGLLYYCVMTAVFLFLTVQSVQRCQYR
ncbi:MAG: ABC transporter permease [Oscillospiraceae bacterium]|nr:ABC transporter permease [Oscillospiraceae bacterium]